MIDVLADADKSTRSQDRQRRRYSATILCSLAICFGAHQYAPLLDLMVP